MTYKEAKEKLYMEWQKFLEDNIDYAGISDAYKTAFKALEQEPKTGHWIAKRIGIIDRELYCDQCGEEALADYPSRFCSNCGAKMMGDIKDIESQEIEVRNDS